MDIARTRSTTSATVRNAMRFVRLPRVTPVRLPLVCHSRPPATCHSRPPATCHSRPPATCLSRRPPFLLLLSLAPTRSILALLWVWVALTPARSVCSVRSVRSSCSCSGRAHPCPLCPLCLLVVMVVLLVVPHAGFDVLQVVAALTSGLALRQLRYAAASKPTNTYTRHTHTQCFRSQRSIAMIAGRTLSPQTTAGQQERAAAAMQRHTKQRL